MEETGKLEPRGQTEPVSSEWFLHFLIAVRNRRGKKPKQNM